MHEWIDVKGSEPDQSLASRISGLGVHVIVDLSGHTGGSRLGALSFRPAPVSMTFLGYPATTGADFVDYYIADRLASPPEGLRHFSESMLYLPPTFYPFNHAQEVTSPPPLLRCIASDHRSDFSLLCTPAQIIEAPTRGMAGLLGSGGQGVLLACFNRNLKIKPDVFEAWLEVLKASPAGTILWLRRFHRRIQDNLTAEAAKRGVSERQLAFAGRLANRL